MELVSVNKLAKSLRLSNKSINLYVNKVINNKNNCVIKSGKRIKIINDRFIDFITNISIEELWQERKTTLPKVSINGETSGGSHIPEMEYKNVDQLKARLLQKQ